MCSFCRGSYELKPTGMDGECDSSEEAEALLQIPDVGTGKRIPI